MTAQPGIYQASANAGELAPRLHGRPDIKQYYSGASLMRNLEPVPQGGYRLSARSVFRGYARPSLAFCPLLGVFTYAPGPHAGPAEIGVWLVANGAFPGSAPVAVVEVEFAGSVARAAALQIEILVNGSWAPVGPPFNIGTDTRRRRAALPPYTRYVVERVRVVLVAGGGEMTVTVDSLIAFQETDALPKARLRPFTFSRDQAYVIVQIPGHMDLWRNGVFVGAVGTALDTDAQVQFCEMVQRYDTMILAHEESATGRIMRRGADHEWEGGSQTFTNAPKVDLGGAYSNTAAIYNLYIRWTSTGSPVGAVVVLTIDGDSTEGTSITSATDWTAFKTNLKANIEDLAGVDDGITIAHSVSTTSCTLTITFTGGTNPGVPFSLTGRVVNDADTSLTSVERRRGRRGGELLASPSRGYPRAVTFYQDRLWLGGYAARGNAVLASVTGDYFNQNIELTGADGALLVGIDSDGAETVEHLVKGRYLLIFTSEAEYFISDRAIARTQPPTIVACSRNGAARGVPIVESENSLLYADKTGSVIYAAAYSDISQAYDSAPISLLASHLIKGVIDAALQAPNDDSDASRFWLVTNAGELRCGVMIRNQDVTAFTRWDTPGLVRAAVVDGANRPFILVERDVGAGKRVFLEELVIGTLVDAAVTINQAPNAIVGGLSMHEGQSVWAIADGFVLGPYTVSGGSITLTVPASTITVGRWTPPAFKTMPVARNVDERTVLQRPVRVPTVRLDLMATTSVAIGANDQPARDQTLLFAGAPTDTPIPPYTGRLEVTGMVGFTPKGIVEVTQIRPGTLNVMAMTYEVKG